MQNKATVNDAKQARFPESCRAKKFRTISTSHLTGTFIYLSRGGGGEPPIAFLTS